MIRIYDVLPATGGCIGDPLSQEPEFSFRSVYVLYVYEYTSADGVTGTRYIYVKISNYVVKRHQVQFDPGFASERSFFGHYCCMTQELFVVFGSEGSIFMFWYIYILLRRSRLRTKTYSRSQTSFDDRVPSKDVRRLRMHFYFSPSRLTAILP